MHSQYDFFRDKEKKIKDYLSKHILLSSYIDETFFEIVSKQVREMERRGLNGPLNSIFLFLLDDSDSGFKQTELLEYYLKLIVEYPTTTKADKNHIKGQLKSDNSIDTLFEISILGNLLKQLPPNIVELFPKTTGARDVEVRLLLDGRWVYLDATVLNDSAGDTIELIDLLNKGGGVGAGKSINFKSDMDRYIRKLEYKSAQFIPNKPNVLAIATIGTRPLFVHSEWGVKVSKIVPNIGMLFEFDRKELVTITTENCDNSCFLTNKEKSLLKELLSGKSFVHLVYR